MAKAKLGIKAKSYRNTATYATPTWSELTIIADLTVNSSWNKANATIRASRIESEVPTTLNLSVTGKLRNDDDDTNFIALLAAYHAGTVVDVVVLDGANTIVASQGYRCEWYLTKWDDDQGKQNVQFYDFELTPANETNVPKTAVVGAGPALAFSALAP